MKFCTPKQRFDLRLGVSYKGYSCLYPVFLGSGRAVTVCPVCVVYLFMSLFAMCVSAAVTALP